MKELTTKELMRQNIQYGWYWCRYADEEEYFPVCIARSGFFCADASIHVVYMNGHGGYPVQGKLGAILRDKEQELRWAPMKMKTKKLRQK